jgi:hypothetical protein
MAMKDVRTVLISWSQLLFFLISTFQVRIYKQSFAYVANYEVCIGSMLQPCFSIVSDKVYFFLDISSLSNDVD